MLLPGARLILTRSTLAIESQEGKLIAVTVPEGAILLILPGYINGHRMVDVSWEDHTFSMFATDVQERGSPTKSDPATL